jgi:hypothetical protein
MQPARFCAHGWVVVPRPLRARLLASTGAACSGAPGFDDDVDGGGDAGGRP